MKTHLKIFTAGLTLLALSTLNPQLATASDQGTAFTYQGKLSSGGAAATGLYDFRFALYDAAAGGTQQGATFATNAVTVTNGYFLVTLNFGGAFDGRARWLDIAVKTNGAASYSPLAPRQPLTPAPYAIMAASASNLLGTLPTAQLTGTFNGNGSGLTGLNPANLSAGTAGINISGSAAAATTANNFSGSLAGEVTGVQSATLVAAVSGVTAANVAAGVNAANAATSANTAGTIVKRDAGGNFSAGNITGSNLSMPATTAGAGIVYSGGSPLIHSYGAYNFFAGGGAGNLTMSGNFNTGLGVEALAGNTSGHDSTAVGWRALYSNTSGSYNTAFGEGALYSNTNGSHNTAGGFDALAYSTNGNYNIALGYQAGYKLTSGSSNIDIGHPGLASDTNIIRIGSGQSQTYIAGQLFGNAAGLTNLNAASLTGILPGLTVDDGGSAAYEEFLGPARSIGTIDPLPFSSLSLVSSNSGAAPALTFRLNGEPFGTVAGFAGHEAISEPYEFVVEILTPNSELDPDAQLGRPGGLVFARNGRSTTWTGIVTGCSKSSYDGTSARYLFRLEPPLASLALSSDYRINQHISVPDLVSSLHQNVTGDTLSPSLNGSYPPQDSLTQYGETDLNFFSRLLEQEGIFYFFSLGGTPPTLILGDSVAACLPAPNSPFRYYGDVSTAIPPGAEFIRTFQKAGRQSTFKSSLNSYNFETPGTSLLVSAPSIIGGVGEHYALEHYLKKSDGDRLVKFRQERIEAEHAAMAGSSTAPDLRPGYTFELDDRTGSGLDNLYLVTAFRHAAFRRLTNGVASLYYGNEFEAIPAGMRFRPALKTPKPVAQASTAVVTGPVGEEIHADEYGRIKVRFYWDRYGANNDTSSAWIRVASPWAGARWGMMFIPRMGQEVMVEFVEGDPDQPVVTGSFYNGANVPPYALPNERTKSTIKSQSSKGGGGANEIRFEDKKGSEEIYVHAQKDLNLAAGNNATTSVGYDMISSVSHDLSLSVTHDLTVSAGHNFTLTSSQGIGLNTANDPAYALNVGGAVKATAFIGSGAGLTGLPVAGLPQNLAYLNSNQTFTALSAFAAPVVLNNLFFAYADGFLNGQDLHLRDDVYHGLGWYGDIKPFGGVPVNGPVVYGFSGGALGVRDFTHTNLALAWNVSGNVNIDPQGANGGTWDHGLTFGTNSGQSIASRSSVGGNRFGLDFYTAGTSRVSIANNGNVGIGTSAPVAPLDVAGDARQRGLLRSGSESGTGEAPNPAGLIMRRVNSTSDVSNTVVAVARTFNNVANINLVRDGTDAGFQIRYPASPGQITIACMGIDNTGTARNFYTTLASPTTAGTVQIYPNTLNIVHFECTFGITYNAGQHLTQVTLSRLFTDNFWSGTLTSTYNQ
jgi:type VI secretion system secreted protein VgrG